MQSISLCQDHLEKSLGERSSRAAARSLIRTCPSVGMCAKPVLGLIHSEKASHVPPKQNLTQYLHAVMHRRSFTFQCLVPSGMASAGHRVWDARFCAG